MNTRIQFFEKLLDGTTAGKLELRRMPWNAEKLKYDSPTDRIFSRDINELEKFSCNGGGDIFHGTNLRDDSGSGKKENITEVVCVTADVDFKTTPQEEIDETLKEFPLDPSMIVSSGNGYHLYWLLDSPLLATDKNVDLAEGIGKGIAGVLGGDHTQDVTRILRTPGRQNSKYVDRTCEIITDNRSRYSIEDLKHFYVPVSSSKGPKVDIGDGEGELPQRFKALLAKNSVARKIWGGERPDLVDQSRSGSDMAMANFLVNFDFPAPEITVILLHMPSGKGADGSRQYFEHTISKAFASRAGKYSESDDQQPLTESQNLTDLGNAKLFATLHEGNVLFSAERKKWILWNGKYWEWDITGKITDYAERVLKYIYEQAAAAGQKDERLSLIKHATKTESRQRIEAMLSLAQTRPEIRTRLNVFDCDPYLFNAVNCTIDLRTGQVREFRREDYLSRISPTAYDPQAHCPLFGKFIDTITMKRPELAAFIQRAAGYSITGETKEQCIFIHHGSGGNGKSTLSLTLTGVWGADYTQQIKAEILCQSKHDNSEYHIAELCGVRVALACESELRRRLATALIKQWTGGEPLVGRRPYELPIRFTPIAKLWFSTNHLPKIDDTTDSIWRRIYTIPFDAKFDGKTDEREKGFETKLLPEASGILNWMIKGCLDWQKSGLNPPDIVLTRTQAYREEEDLIATFIQEKCLIDKCEWIEFGALYQSYVEWCESEGERPENSNSFGRALSEKGYPMERYKGVRGRQGLRLKDYTE